MKNRTANFFEICHSAEVAMPLFVLVRAKRPEHRVNMSLKFFYIKRGVCAGDAQNSRKSFFIFIDKKSIYCCKSSMFVL
jgi:hypothetical protein